MSVMPNTNWQPIVKTIATKGKLQIHEEEAREPTEKRNGDQVGLTTGLCLTHFVNELFYANYEAHLTDEALREALLSEFPKRAVIQAPSAYRGYFNAGKHGHGLGEALDDSRRLPCYRTPKPKKEKAQAPQGEAPKGKGKGKAQAQAEAPAPKGKTPKPKAKK